VYLGVGQEPQAEALRVTVTVAIRNPTRIQLLVLSSCEGNPGKEGTWAGPAAGGKLLVAVTISLFIMAEQLPWVSSNLADLQIVYVPFCGGNEHTP
jgi:hypothetical protein